MRYIENVKSELDNRLKSLLDESSNFNLDFSIYLPEIQFGDLSTNFCLVVSKVLNITPLEVYEKIQVDLEKNLNKFVEKIEFVNPGFINFSIKADFIRKKINNHKTFLEKIFSKEEILSEKYYGKKVIVEFTSINLFKPFIIGHLMSNFTGEYISRSLEAVGAKVVRISYPSDISIGIAKAIYIIKNDGGLLQEIFEREESEIVKYLGESYVRGVAEYKKFQDENDLEKIGEVKEIASNLYGNIESVDLEIFERTKKINIEYFKKMVNNLGTKFDDFIYESEAGVVGKKIVEENIREQSEHLSPNGGSKVFTHSEGAIIYTPSEERKDINTSVFINSEGNPTYLAKDIGLLDLKFKKYPDLNYSIYVVDNEQNSHFKSVFDAGGMINKEWEEKSIHVSTGRMTFKGQKMSSRLGGVPSAEEIIEAVYDDVTERSDEKIKGLTDEEKKKTQMEIALSALRISILRSKPGVNIDFDPEKASSFEGDSGPYLCYTFARCCSLLEKGKSSTPPSPTLQRWGTEQTEVTKIERKVFQFEEVLRISAEEIAPQKLVKYLFELASEFNSFYAQEKIISDDMEKTQYNLYLTNLVASTLKRGLFILGINAPEKM